MKNREQKKKWTGKKHIWYGMAGLFCLAAAVLILTFGNGMGAQAESRAEYEKINLTLNDGVYQITTAQELLALGNASEEQTKDHTYKLTKDIPISSIEMAATGTFAGTFDGDGHVITIEKLEINDETTGTSAQGVLFGTVTGTVQNVIVDIKDENASYTRTSDAGTTSSSNPATEWIDNLGNKTDEEPKPYTDENTLVSEFDTEDTQKEAYEKIKKYDNNTAANQSVEIKWTKTETEVTTKNPNKAGEDSFGIICGNLQGTVEQVEVTGNKLQINQQATKTEDATVTETKETKDTYSYEKVKNYKFSQDGEGTKTVSLGMPTFYDKENEKDSKPNDAVGEILSIEASAPANILVNTDKSYSITYTVTVKAVKDTVPEVTLKAPDKITGEWERNGKTIKVNGNTIELTNVEKGGTTVTFIYTGSYVNPSDSDETDINTVSMQFRASTKVGEQMVTALTSSMETKVYPIVTNSSSDKISAIETGALEISITGVDEIASTAALLTYTVTVTNGSKNQMKEIELSYDLSTWSMSETDKTKQVLNTGESKKYTFVKKGPLEVNANPSLTVTAEGKLYSSNTDYQKVAATCTKSTSVIAAPNDTKTPVFKGEENSLQVKIDGNDELYENEALSYNVTVTNKGAEKLSDVQLTVTDGSNWKITDKKLESVSLNNGAIIVGELDAYGSQVYTFTKAGNLAAGKNVSLTVSASGMKESSSSTASVADTSSAVDTGATSTKVNTGDCTKKTTIFALPSETTTPKNAKSAAVNKDNLAMDIKSPKYVSNSGVVEYQVSVTSAFTGEVSLTGPKGGTWSENVEGDETANDATENDETGSNQHEIKFQITANESKSFTFKLPIGNQTSIDGSNFILTSGDNACLSVTASKVNVYDGSTKASSTARKNNEIASGTLTLKASVPAVCEMGDDKLQLIYTIDGTKLQKDTKLTASQTGGIWSGQNTAEDDGTYVIAEDEADVTYTLTVTKQESDTYPISVYTNFTAIHENTDWRVYTETKKLKTDIYEKGATLSAYENKTEKSASDLQVTLSVPAYVIGNTAEYTLALTNSSGNRIYIGSGTTGWDYDNTLLDSKTYKSVINGETVEPQEGLAGFIIPAGEKIELKQKITKQDNLLLITVKLSDIQQIKEGTAYRFIEKKNQSSSTDTSTDNPSIYAANSLCAGVIAGKSSSGSTIKEVSQKVDLSAQAMEGLADNGAVLAVGGITGKAEGTTLQDLYVRGNVTGGNYLIGTGTVSKLQHIIVTSTLDTANLGVANGSIDETVLVGDQAAIQEGWNNWKEFTYYQSASETDKVTTFDLRWLIKEDKLKVASPEGAGTTVTVSVDNGDRAITSWKMVYRARQKKEDANNQLYYSNTSSLPLGESGYYQIVNLYATDDYYHYVKGEDENVTYPFTYDKKKPVFYEESKNPWEVVRAKKETLTDQIQLTLKSDIADNTIIYYYNNTNTLEEAANATENVNTVKVFPFDEANVTLQILPCLDGKWYEEFASETFGEERHLPLPAPRVTVTDFYNRDGKENVVDFEHNASYGESVKAALTQENENCSYQYYVSDTELAGDSWKLIEKPEHNEQEYTTESSQFENITWSDCGSGFRLAQEDLESGASHQKYLYIKVEADGYPTTVYKYGSCTIYPEAKTEIHVYLDDNTELAENDRVVSEDRFSFKFTVETADELGMSKLQYRTSTSELTGESLYVSDDWKDYDNTQVVINRENDEDGYYIYARVYNQASGKYQKAEMYHYTFADIAGTASISPRTVSVEIMEETPAAATIASSSPIYLSTQQEGGRILYLISSSLEDRFSFKRVTENLSGLKDGEGGYYKIGNRWYQTSEKVRVYEDAITLYNESANTELQYIHAAVLGSDGEPGETITYAYKVSPMGQTSAPEASMDTLHFPGGEDMDSTKVLKGASLSFQSLTPGAELYYVLGEGTAEVLDHEEGETKLYDEKNGIEVTGDYGDQFVVRMKAVKWSTDGTGRKELNDSETIRFIYTISDQEQAVAPTATPSTSDQEMTVITPGDKILLSTTTKGASIYYTTDGSEPQVTQNEDGTFTAAGNTLLYDAGQGIVTPESGNGYFTVRAIAVHPDLAVSAEAKFTYSYPSDVETPYANIPSGDVDKGTEIILKNKTDGASIYYTVSRDGNAPADPTISSSVFDASQPIVINGETIIKAIAVKDGMKSGILTLTYNSKEQLSAPTASIDSGAMVSRGTRLKLKAADGATIYYTLDGSDPSEQSNSSVVSGTELILDGSAGSTVTVKACARKDGKSVSEVVTFTYQISQSAGGVTADVENGTSVSIGSKINLMTDVTDADIYYTTDGSDPADHGIKGNSVTVEGTSGSSFMIKAVAVVDGEAGSVCTFTYKIKEKPTAPTASPSGGTLTVATRVELSSSAEKIYYTTDGVTPTESSNLYKEPILINKTTNLKAIAVSADGEISEVASFQYTAALKAEKPTASHETGTVLEPGTIVALHTNTSGAEIYYSTDGTEPTMDNLDSMTLYTEEGITINRTVTILAVAYRKDMQLSAVTELNYQVDTIPAVEQKKAEEALLEETQLKDTDSSELARVTEQEGTSYQSRVLRERDYDTVVSSTWETIPSDAVLVTEKQDYEEEALTNVKQLFGEEYTILDSYDMYLMRGSTMIQPDGEVEIGIPIPETYTNAAVTIVYIDKNHKVTKKETRREDGMAYAKTDHFSNYALVGLEEEATDGWTFDYLLLLQIAAAATVAAGIVYWIIKKSKRMKKNR